MPLYGAGNVVECQLLFRLIGQECMIVPYFEMKTTTALPTTFSAMMETVYWQTMKQICSNRALCYGIKSRRVYPDPVGDYVTEFWPESGGTVTSNINYEGAASIIVLDHQGQPAYKNGRMYPPGSGLGYVNGAYDASGLGRLNSYCTAAKNLFAVGGTNSLVYQLKRTVIGSTVLWFRVTNYRYRNYIGSQRRRRPTIGG